MQGPLCFAVDVGYEVLTQRVCGDQVGEIGELCECFQWKKDPESQPGLPAWSEKDKEHLGEELSDVSSPCHVPVGHTSVSVGHHVAVAQAGGGDSPAEGVVEPRVPQVLLYLLRLADKCNIDLPSATLRKLEKNAKKYPAHLVKGSREKYTVYEGSAAAKEEGEEEAPGAKRHRAS